MAPSAAESAEARVLIAGAGIGGLALALALKKHCGLAGSEIEVYEQAPAFGDGVGGGMGLYANGLRVLRDIDPELLATVRSYGYDYLFRRWQRHDGTEVACASEEELCSEPDLQSLGIRRWKLQKALCDASAAAGIKIRFGMRTETVTPREDGADGLLVVFADGSKRNARVVFGADGLKSKVRDECSEGVVLYIYIYIYIYIVANALILDSASIISFVLFRCARRWWAQCPRTSQA